jgi:hypothetical protein
MGMEKGLGGDGSQDQTPQHNKQEEPPGLVFYHSIK